MAADNNKRSLYAENSTTSTHVPVPREWTNFARGGWIVLALFCGGLFLAGLPARFNALLQISAQHNASLLQLGITPEFRAWYLVSLEIIFMLGFTAIAVFIFVQKSNDLAILIISLLLLSFGTTFLNAVVALSEVYPVMLGFVRFAKFLAWSLLIPVLYLFPNGRWVPRWTKWLALSWILWNSAWLVFPDLPTNPTIRGLLQHPILFYLYFVWFLTGIIAQIYRAQKVSSPSQRQQTKWIVFGFAVAILGSFLEELPSMLSPALMLKATPAGTIYEMASTTIFVLVALVVPVTIGISIRRNRLWAIDFVINRSLVFTALTAILAAIFIGIILMLESIFRSLTGGDQPTLAVAISAMAIAGLFQPTRRRLQRIIDQRLYHIQIDYRKKLSPAEKESFTFKEASLKIGEYIVHEPIGRGGMAEIYHGKHTALERDVAIKVLPPQMAVRDDFRKRFSREAQAIASLRHPNIVQLFDFGEAQKIFYMVMEFIPGDDLGQYLKAHGPLDFGLVRELIKEIAEALDYSHNQGIIHRDIKPSNIMLRPLAPEQPHKFRPILTDFGIAKILSGTQSLTQTGIVGTFDYIAPEQIQISEEIDGRADVYSLGIMAFQMLTGTLPFPSGNPGATLIAHMQHPPPNPARFRPDLSDEIVTAIFRALEKKPAKRFTTAGEFAAAL